MPPVKVYRGRPQLPKPEKVFAQRPQSKDLENETDLEKSRLWNIQARMQNKGLRFTTSFLFPMHSYEGKYLDIVQCCSPIGILFLNKQQIQDLLVNIYGPTLFARIKFDEYDVEELRFCLCRTYGLSVGDWLGLIRAEQVVIRQDTNAIHYRGQGNGNSKSEASLVWSFKP